MFDLQTIIAINKASNKLSKEGKSLTELFSRVGINYERSKLCDDLRPEYELKNLVRVPSKKGK